MSQQQTRKRGANYTQEEKSLLLDLVMQFKGIIECKRTGGKFIERKREAWNAVTMKYNSSCTSGPRDTDQLKSLYDNMKQKSRKDVGESNKLAYINAEQNRMVTEDDVARAIRNIKEDKVEMNKTGGGFWKPKMTDNDAKVLAIIQDQVEPLYNPYDSASSFFKEPAFFTAETDVNINSIIPIPGSASTSCPPPQEIIVIAEERQPSDSITVEVHSTPKIAATPKRANLSSKKKAFKQRKMIKPASAEALKKLYFKKKCQNADLERKKLMLEILHMKKEHSLKMEILKNKEKNVEFNI
ncbi:hypothetical protein PYW08_002691 [Mythimna loreyi]|uniref:Uncharacterized protein n=1 Tax=Mythimna loreyi TaxID=667449 RepID=A0ACC2QIL7_9NEOP|nr:hypothetical protein PYW08_002691 [Mythimna loreyi]